VTLSSLATRPGLRLIAPAALLAAAACADQQPPTASQQAVRIAPAATVQALDCQADLRAGAVSCGAPAPSGSAPRRAVFGGQGSNVVLTSSNISNGSGVLQFDVTVTNLLPEGIGTPDGTVVDPEGITAFFHSGPTVTGGTGTATVANADGTGDFTGTNQPYFRWNEKLAHNEVSSVKTWQIAYDPGVTNVAFKVFIKAELQPLLVINEVMANPANPGSSIDTDREWFEVYNAGRFPVQMQGMLIADSAASGRRPYHLISSALEVPSGGYVVLGNSTNTTNNGGVTVDYAYGGALALANSLDAVKISRLYSVPGDTLTIDRTQYSNASTSAKDGVSRELKNPALDNSNMDGSNWGDAAVTSVYGTGGRGTPKAQNSVYVP
jgi:hypothetical protein